MERIEHYCPQCRQQICSRLKQQASSTDIAILAIVARGDLQPLANQNGRERPDHEFSTSVFVARCLVPIIIPLLACSTAKSQWMLQRSGIGCLHDEHHLFCCGALVRTGSCAPVNEKGYLSWTLLWHSDASVLSSDNSLPRADLPEEPALQPSGCVKAAHSS